MSGLRVTREHVFTIPGFSPRPGFCRGGARRWFRRHGLDWSTFVREGIDAATLEAIGDEFALATVAWARKCEEQPRG